MWSDQTEDACPLSASIQEGDSGLHSLHCTGLGRAPFYPMPLQTFIVVGGTGLKYINLTILDTTRTQRDLVLIELRGAWNGRFSYLGNPEYRTHFSPLPSPAEYGSTGEKS